MLQYRLPEIFTLLSLCLPLVYFFLYRRLHISSFKLGKRTYNLLIKCSSIYSDAIKLDHILAEQPTMTNKQNKK